jgi:hypothetical protein
MFLWVGATRIPAWKAGRGLPWKALFSPGRAPPARNPIPLAKLPSLDEDPPP